MTDKELRELDAKIETEIFGRCPHLHYQFTTGAFPRHDYTCSECNQTFNAPHCPQYHKSWDAVFGLLVPEMERREFHLRLEHILTNPYGTRIIYRARFWTVEGTGGVADHEDGRIAVCLAALAAVEMEKK